MFYIQGGPQDWSSAIAIYLTQSEVGGKIRVFCAGRAIVVYFIPPGLPPDVRICNFWSNGAVGLSIIFLLKCMEAVIVNAFSTGSVLVWGVISNSVSCCNGRQCAVTVPVPRIVWYVLKCSVKWVVCDQDGSIDANAGQPCQVGDNNWPG